MRLELTGRHVQITPGLRRLVDRKLARLERILSDSALSAAVVLGEERNGRRVDISLHARGEKFLHGVASAATWEAAVSLAVAKLARQARRVKGKWRTRKRQGPKAPPLPTAAPPPAAEARRPRGTLAAPKRPHILRVSRQAIKAMSVADAMRLVTADGDGVLVFRDSETTAINVLFRRSDGELTLVETEA